MYRVSVYFRLCMLAFTCTFLISCTSNTANLVGLGESALPFAQTNGATVQNLFVATTRLRSADAVEFFSGERAQDLGLGNVDVTIPPIHKVGQIERPTKGSNDSSKYFTIGRPLIFNDSAGFKSQLNRAIMKRPPGERKVLVFVHGYNTNFSDAVLRITQFVHDTGFTGVPVLFTWASRGKTIDYVYDINSALQARFYLVELAHLLADTDAEAFSIVAHSMGNLVTLEAMTALALKRNFTPKGRLQSVILAAPDVDYDLFVEHLKKLDRLKPLIFVLVSKDDKALSFSRRIAGGVSRVGAANPERLAALGLNVVDLSQIDDESNANHSKFADSPAIVQLIGTGMQNGITLSTSPSASASPPNIIGATLQGVVRIPSKLVGGQSGRVVTVAN